MWKCYTFHELIAISISRLPKLIVDIMHDLGWFNCLVDILASLWLPLTNREKEIMKGLLQVFFCCFDVLIFVLILSDPKSVFWMKYLCRNILTQIYYLRIFVLVFHFFGTYVSDSPFGENVIRIGCRQQKN